MNSILLSDQILTVKMIGRLTEVPMNTLVLTKNLMNRLVDPQIYPNFVLKYIACKKTRPDTRLP